MAKNVPKIYNIGIFAILMPLRGMKTLQKYFYPVEEVLSFNLVCMKYGIFPMIIRHTNCPCIFLFFN